MMPGESNLLYDNDHFAGGGLYTNGETVLLEEDQNRSENLFCVRTTQV